MPEKLSLSKRNSREEVPPPGSLPNWHPFRSLMSARLGGLLFGAGCLLLPPSAEGALTNWINPSLGNWAVPTNWTGNTLPDAATGAVVANGGTALLNSSSWQALGLFVGVPTAAGSTGSLVVDAGIVLSVGGQIRVGGSTSPGVVSNGMLSISGGALIEQTANFALIGEGNQGSTGTVTVTGFLSELITTTSLTVGTGNSHGNLNLQNGGRLGSAGPTAIAGTSGSTGMVSVTGAGSAWQSTGGIFVGGADGSASGGSGALRISGGGFVRAPLLKQWSTGLVEVDNGSSTSPGLIVTGTTAPPAGAGALGDLAVGSNGIGRMEITAGGDVFTSRGFMGGNAGSNGTALLSGSGSTWTCNGSVYVGNSGDGELTVTSNAFLSSAGHGYIAFANNTVGNAAVTNGGRWSTAGTLFVGGNGGGPGGSGTLTVLNAIVNAAACVIYNTGGLVIAGPESRLLSPTGSALPLTINGGYVQAGANTEIFNGFTLGTEGVRFFTAGFTLETYGAISGPGGITKGGHQFLGAGTLILNNASNYTGPTVVSTGALRLAGGSSITSPVTVNSGAALQGFGAVGGVTLNNNAVLQPGFSEFPSRLTVNGNYNQTSGGFLEIKLAGYMSGDQFDQVVVSGSAAVDGTLRVRLVNGFVPLIGDTFAILTSNGLSGNFSSIESPGLSLRSDASPNGVVLTVVGVGPEISNAGSAIISAGANGFLDLGETVVVSLGVKKNAGPNGDCTTAALTGTLQAMGGVSDPSVPQEYGALCSGDPASFRNFTFTVDPAAACGDTITASLALVDGATTYETLTYFFTVGNTILAQNFDSVTAPTLPAGWSSTASGAGITWVTSTTGSFSSPNGAFAPNPNLRGDMELFSPSFDVPTDGAKLTFKNNYNTEATWDGMVLEISINGDAYVDLLDAGGSFEAGGYNDVIRANANSALAGRMAWTGNSNGYQNTIAILPASAAGQNVQLKWRMATDIATGDAGVRIDDISVRPPVCRDVGPPLVLRMTGFSRVGNDLAFEFGDVSVGNSYRLEQKVDLTNPVWEPVVGVPDFTPDQNGSGTIFYAGGFAARPPPVFFRVRLLSEVGGRRGDQTPLLIQRSRVED